MSKVRVLVVDDEEDMLEVCRDSLRPLDGVEVLTECDPLRALDRIAQESIDLLVVDLRMPRMSGIELVKHAQERQPHIESLVITAYPTVETAVDALKSGAIEYLCKPFGPDLLREKVRSSLERVIARRGAELGGAFDGILGESPPMRTLFRTILQIAPTTSDVLILGESGTGKELIARSIHKRSGRAGRFVAVDCGAIPEHLMESELFGHERGAFTGAVESRSGLLELAHGGTFFLDEVCELPPQLQVKLLRALQERRFRRLGGDEEIDVDVRVIAATNRDIDREVKEGRFREDLYYRINVVRIEVPPLRERNGDVLLLATHFLRRFAHEMGKSIRGFDEAALEVLKRHPWPGNVRELRNAVQRAVTLSTRDRIRVTDLPEEIRRTPLPDTSQDFQTMRAKVLEAFERGYLVELLSRVEGDVAQACRIADLPRSTLYRMLSKYGIRPADFR